MELSVLAALGAGVGASAVVCAVSWLVLARWLRVPVPHRGWLALAIPLIVGGSLLWLDGAPFNGVVAVVLFVPVMTLDLLVIVILENALAP